MNDVIRTSNEQLRTALRLLVHRASEELGGFHSLVTLAEEILEMVPAHETSELQRLRHIESMALRVASSRRKGIVTDKTALDNLDAALEATESPAETPNR